MKLLFVINDGDAKYVEYEHTGVLNAPSRRAVEIKLTSDQIKKIGIKETKCFNREGAPVMETIESVSILNEISI